MHTSIHINENSIGTWIQKSKLRETFDKKSGKIKNNENNVYLNYLNYFEFEGVKDFFYLTADFKPSMLHGEQRQKQLHFI